MSRMDLHEEQPEPVDAGTALVEAAERKRRKAAAPPKVRAAEPVAPAAQPQAQPEPLPRSALGGIQAGAPSPLSPWSWTAILLGCALIGLSLAALAELPAPQRVTRVTISWLPGPQVPEREVIAWMRRFPQWDRLGMPNDWVLDQLATWLRRQPAVERVALVAAQHEPAANGAPRRTLHLSLGLRTPYLPATLADGRRVWVDASGHLLPNTLPPPPRGRPMLRQVEAGGRQNLDEVLRAWPLLESRLGAGLVSDILLAEPLDETGAKGIVLRLTSGTRLIWGRADDARVGITPEAKAQAVARTLRAQGSLARVESINVRFREPVYVPRRQAP